MTFSPDAFVAMFWTAIAAHDPIAARHVLRIFAKYHEVEAADLTAAVIAEAAS